MSNLFRKAFISKGANLSPLFVLDNGDSRKTVTEEREKKMRKILEQKLTRRRVIDSLDDSSGTKIGILGKLFGCWHRDLTRPFTSKTSSYRVCTECGARRLFDTKSFKTLGRFYYPPSVSSRP